MANISYLLRPDSTDLDDPYHPFFYSSAIPVVRSSLEEEEDFLSSDPESVVLDHHSQAAFVMDLLHDRVERSSSSPSPNRRAYRGDDDDELGFGIVEEDPDRFDFGLGFRDFVNGLYIGEGEGGEEEEDGFFVHRRGSSAIEDEDEEEARSGVRVVGGIGMSDSEIEEEDEAPVNFEEEGDNYLNEVEFYGGGYEEEDDVSVEIPLCWDSLRLEDNEDFGWEEVDARVDEREVMSVFVGEAEYEEEVRGEVEDEDDDASLSFSVAPVITVEDLVSVESVGGGIVVEGEGEEVEVGVLGNVEWEVLLNANNFISGAEDHELEHHLGGTYFGDHNNDYVYPAEYETLFGQFTENENALIAGRPPAAKSAVENLLPVAVSKEDVDGDNALCAVCKDGFCVGEQVKQLPCSHRYHGDCIVPWLGIRNTCPVCRYELPTDDPDYERRQGAATQRGA